VLLKEFVGGKRDIELNF